MSNKGHKCSVLHCKNYQCKESDLTYHSVPLNNEELRRTWIDFCGNPTITTISKRKVVCSSHFSLDDYEPASKRLKKDACPSLLPPSTDSPTSTNKSRGYYCSMIGCNNRQNGQSRDTNDHLVRFHLFPMSPHLRKCWVVKCKNASLDSLTQTELQKNKTCRVLPTL